MAEDPNARKDLISRIGTFFVVVSLFLIIIFIASDISRNNAGRQVSATQTFIVASVQALQTRDAGAAQAAPQNLPTPTLAPVTGSNSDDILAYTPAFCLGAFGLLVGWFLRKISASPSKPSSNRWEGIRKMQQKQREAEAKKKEKTKKK